MLDRSPGDHALHGPRTRTRRNRKIAGSAIAALLLAVSCSGGSNELTDQLTDDGTTVEGLDVTTDAADAEGVEPVIGALTGCVVQASDVSLTPVWRGQNPGMAVVIRRDGAVVYTTDPAPAQPNEEGAFSDVGVKVGVTYNYEVQAVAPDGTETESVSCGAGRLLTPAADLTCGVRISDEGLPEISWDASTIGLSFAVFRDGREIASGATPPFIDQGAPVEVGSEYSITASDSTDQGRPAQSAVCGSATPTLAETGGSLDLAVALDQARSFPSPYQYVVLTPICAGCTGDVELYLKPSPEDPIVHTVAQVWRNGVPAELGNDVWMIDPLVVPSLLVDAQRSGSDITYDIDLGTGLVRSWTIDGVGASYTCLEVDTRPIDLRSTRCEANLLG